LFNYFGISQDFLMGSINYKQGNSFSIEVDNYNIHPSNVVELNMDYLFDNSFSFGIGIGTGKYISRSYTYRETNKENPNSSFVYARENHHLVHNTLSGGFGFLFHRKLLKRPVTFHTKLSLQCMMLESKTFEKIRIPQDESNEDYLAESWQLEKRDYNSYSLNTIFQQHVIFKLYKNWGINLGIELCNASMLLPGISNFQVRAIGGINYSFSIK
jgi:hypothetical protein